MNKPKVGQTLYSLNVGNAARHYKEILTPVTVHSVGRKYFTIYKSGLAVQFHISDWCEKTEYMPNYCLYETEQEFLDSIEYKKNLKYVKEFFSVCGKINIDTESLRKIALIIKVIE